MQKFEFLRQPLLGELAMSWREREKRKKMPFIVATYVSSCSPRAAHTLRSDQLVTSWWSWEQVPTFTFIMDCALQMFCSDFPIFRFFLSP